MVAANDVLHRRKAQAPPVRLRGEEGFEHPVDGLGAHSAAGIAHFEKRVESVAKLLGPRHARKIGRPGAHHARGEGDDARPLVHRVRRVGDEVHQHLPDLRGLGLDDDRGRRELVMQFDALADARGEEVRHLAHEGVEVDVGDVE